MLKKIEKQLAAGPRPSRVRRRLKWLAAALLALILLAGGGAWLAGRLLMDRLAEALSPGRAAEIKAGLVLALPLVDLAYGRDVVIQLKGERPPVRLTLKSFWVRSQKNEDGGRFWNVNLGEIRLERGAGALGATRLKVDGSYDRTAGRFELTDGRVDYLVLSAGRTAMTSFTRLSFRRLAFDARAWRLALGRGEAGEGPLDLFWQVDQGRLEEFRFGLAFLEGYETAPLNVGFTGHNNPERWALALDMNTAKEAADDLGNGQRRSLRGVLNKPAQNLDMAKLLRFDRLSLNCGGAWAEGPAAGDEARIRTESVFLFPRLFTMTVNGSGAAVTRGQAAAWLDGCFRPDPEGARPNSGADQAARPVSGLTSLAAGRDGGSRTRCLSALGFDTFSVDYGDRGLTFILRPIKSFRDKIFRETDPSGPLGPPALGLALGLWLDEQSAKVPAGNFTFKTGDGQMHPFRREFFAGIQDGSVEVRFEPPSKPQGGLTPQKPQ